MDGGILPLSPVHCIGIVKDECVRLVLSYGSSYCGLSLVNLWIWSSSRFYLFCIDYLNESASTRSLRGFHIFLGSLCVALNYIPTLHTFLL
jgi:hypothetical protein